MLRFFVGSTLVLFAAILPTDVPADRWGLSDDNRSLLEQLSRPKEMTDEEKGRLEQETERFEQGLQNVRNVERMMDEKRASLAKIGLTFEISSFSGSRLLAACLIGETGKAYMYDPKKQATAQTTGFVDEGEFAKAAALAKSIGHSEWRPQQTGYDFGVVAWTVSFDARTTLLQISGDYLGALPDPRVRELVILIDGWCPNAQEIRSRDLPAFAGRFRP